LAAGIDRDLWRVGGAAGGDRIVFVDSLEAKDQSCEEEGIADGKRLDEILLDLAEDTAAAPGKRVAALAGRARLEGGGFDDGADIGAMVERDVGRGEPPKPVGTLPDPGVALVGFQRIAASRNELEDTVEGGAWEVAIGPGGDHLAVERIDAERRRAGHAED